MKNNKNKAIITLSCIDSKGIVNSISDFISKNNGNIIHSDQHIDEDQNLLFMRVEWIFDDFSLNRQETIDKFKIVAEKYNMNWEINFSNAIKKTAIFVSKYDHCLQDILLRHKAGELSTEIVCVISNHEDLRALVESYNIEYNYIPKDKTNKVAQEKKELEILKKHKVDLIVLARYMQVLSDNFVSFNKNKIINIHHSFLPAFVGSNPYMKAFQRGVKIIGATSHYVTKDLDEGPIIEQDVARISHRDNLRDMKRIGKDLEKLVLVRALRWHIENKILSYGKKTVVFD